MCSCVWALTSQRLGFGVQLNVYINITNTGLLFILYYVKFYLSMNGSKTADEDLSMIVKQMIYE